MQYKLGTVIVMYCNVKNVNAISKQQKTQIKELYRKPHHLRGSSSTQAGKFPVITVMGSEKVTVVK